MIISFSPFFFIQITSENFRTNSSFPSLKNTNSPPHTQSLPALQNNKYQTQNDLVDIIKRRNAILGNKNTLASDSVNFKNCHEIDKCYPDEKSLNVVYIYLYMHAQQNSGCRQNTSPYTKPIQSGSLL